MPSIYQLRLKPWPEAVDTGTRVIADLEHRADASVRELERAPVLDARTRRQVRGEEVLRVAAGMVVQNDNLAGAPIEKAGRGRSDIRGEPGTARGPVLLAAREDLADPSDLRDGLHIRTQRNAHRQLPSWDV